VVARRLVDSGHFTIRKGGGVEPRRVLCVLVEPEADRVFWFHVSFTFFPKLAGYGTKPKGRAGTDVLPIPSSADAFRSEHCELPGVGSLIVADEIRITVCAFQLEISVVGRQPGVEYLRDGYPTVTKNQRVKGRRTPFLSAMSMLGAKDNESRSYLEFVDVTAITEDDNTAS